MRFLPVNLDALLVELDDLSQTLALRASLTARLPTGVHALVPGARTILVRFDPTRTHAQAVVDDIARRALDGAARQQARARILIPVHYDGEDLDEVAGMLGTSRQNVIALHTGTDYHAAFSGFAPGFAYLSGGDPRLNVPRKPSPRTRVPAGSVALAGQFSAVYPQQSPGGWQLLGTTPLVMWDVRHNPPAIVQPGDRVRFVDAAALAQTDVDAMCAAARREADAACASAPAATPDASAPVHALRAAASCQPTDAVRTSVAQPDACTASLHVQASGVLTLFQDMGRHGQTASGVCASGAVDPASLRAANRLVGNPPNTACLEVTLGGLTLKADGRVTLAVTGADVEITLHSAAGTRRHSAHGQAFTLGDGDTVSLGMARAGVRAYVAVRGGFAVDPVLGSCATDTLAWLGPPPVRRGDRLRVRTQPPALAVDHPIAPDTAHDGPLPRAGDCVTLDIVMGPRTDWFTPDAVASFCAQAWRVTPESNRVGMRLAGTAIARTQATQTLELPSEGTTAGSIQILPSGQPVLFLADHPLSGGYPVIAAVATHHLHLAGQIPINASIRFHAARAFAPFLPTPQGSATRQGPPSRHG